MNCAEGLSGFYAPNAAEEERYSQRRTDRVLVELNETGMESKEAEKDTFFELRDQLSASSGRLREAFLPTNLHLFSDIWNARCLTGNKLLDPWEYGRLKLKKPAMFYPCSWARN